MAPDPAFLLILVFRMAVAAAFVVSASMIAERTGPVIGALVATLPISAGPAYVFLALDHDAAFIAQGALASLPINAATLFLGLTYVLLAQRHSLPVGLLSAMASQQRIDVASLLDTSGVSPEVARALVQHAGRLGRVLAAVLAHEENDAEQVAATGLDPSDVARAYLDAVPEALSIATALSMDPLS